MPYASDGSFTRTTGTYTGSTAWAQESAAGNTIQASKFDTHDADIASGIGDAIGKWTTWSPTYSAGGSMTFTSTTTAWAQYLRTGRRVECLIYVTGTIGGTPDISLKFTLPVSANVRNSVYVGDGNGSSIIGANFTGGAHCGLDSATVASVGLYDNSNWTTGAGRGYRIHLVYEAA